MKLFFIIFKGNKIIYNCSMFKCNIFLLLKIKIINSVKYKSFLWKLNNYYLILSYFIFDLCAMLFGIKFITIDIIFIY